jgi:YgiT-type zinc finger domain-containing protein
MQETLIDTTITYSIVYEGKLYVVENVPARVCQETGEEYFAPETVERIHSMIKGKKQPDRLIEAPVYKYA